MKKIILMILLSIYPATANAGFWSGIGACITDPCNCGDSNSERWEDWNGLHIDKGKRNRNCPPWNKTDGRNDHTCLVKASLPQAFIGYYENLCGEETPESTYLNPKIKVRGQQCNAVACWTTSNSLSWDGECVTLASGYGIPLLRMCARIAIPADYQAGFAQDPGYTTGQHLNFEGATVPDDTIIGYDGNAVSLDPPKLCLYKDPAFLSLSDGFDVMDLDPNKQSAHKTSALHPVVKVILFFADIASQTSQTTLQLLGTLFDMMNNGDNSQTTFTSVLKDLFQYIGWIIQQIGSTIISFLRDVGQINRVVDSTIYGCVNIPMGPYPPPFCPTIIFSEDAYTQKICRRDASGAPLPSTESEPCVVSTLENNVVRNSVRITFEKFVPLCTAGQLPNSDKCVTIDNLGVFGTASGLHAATGRTDILPPCVSAPAGATCVNTTIPHNCSVSADGCQGGFRVVYGVKMGTTSSPASYFKDDLADCPSNNSTSCQQIWGVNTAEFVDVSLVFPFIQTTPDVTPLQTSASLTNGAGEVVDFSVFIPRIVAFDSVLQFTPDPKQICVIHNDTVSGCENRAPLVKPLVIDCDSPGSPIACTNDYFQPQFVAVIMAGNDATTALVEPLSVYNPSAVASVNLAGYNFDSFVTDDSFMTKPFSGDNVPNPNSLFGTYENNLLPPDSDAVYLYGLEYINGSYHIGGKYACLKNVDADKCPTNVNNCVLTNLINRNIANCDLFMSAFVQYPNLQLCTDNQTPAGCSSIQTITGSSGNVSIYSCNSATSYCYTSTGSANPYPCQISLLPADRFKPSAALGAILQNSQYYDANLDPNYDRTQYGLRDKTAREMNLCVTTLQPKCAAINTYNSANGFASWPATTVGKVATGTCSPGKFSNFPLKRRCAPNPDTQTFEFTPIYHLNNSGVEVYDNSKCQ